MYSHNQHNAKIINFNIDTTRVGYNRDPEMFGPSFWFTLHNGAAAYPVSPTPWIRASTKQLLISLPILIPCINCREHFFNFVRSSNLDDAVASRDKLFDYFVRAHNYVNARYGKPIMSIDEAKRMYGFDTGKVLVKLNYN